RSFGKIGLSHAGFVEGSNWLDVAVTTEHCYAVQTDGTLWDLSDFEQTGSSPKPFGESRDWKRIAASRDCFVGLKSDGTLWEWGRFAVFGNNVWSSGAINGQVQVGTDHDWIDVWGSSDTIVALKADHSVWRSHFIRYEDQNNGRFVDEPERWLNFPRDN